EEHRSQCLLWVGDPTPEISLPDLEGTDRKLKEMLGEKLTVLLLWTSQPPDDLYSEDALGKLTKHVLSAYQEQGVNVVGIHKGSQTEDAVAAAERATATFPLLLDAEGTACGQFATERIPRVYLLDAEGKILWLDDHFSTQTRTILEQAIKAALGSDESVSDPG
ncbi:MAG: peroxiredoxin family protein, partial [Planctomycetales bacterium]